MSQCDLVNVTYVNVMSCRGMSCSHSTNVNGNELTFECVAVRVSVLQYGSVCCSTGQCVAVNSTNVNGNELTFELSMSKVSGNELTFELTFVCVCVCVCVCSVREHVAARYLVA